MPTPTRKNIMNKMLSHGRKSKHPLHWKTRRNLQSGKNRDPSPLKPTHKPKQSKSKPKGKFWNSNSNNDHPDY